MNRQFFSKTRHTSLQFCSPVNSTNVANVVRAIKPFSGGRLLEIGCGKGEILASLIEQTNSSGLGVDLPGSLAENLSPLAIKLRESGRLELLLQDGKEFVAKSSERFDVVIFSGASQAIGGFSKLPEVVIKLLKPEGWMVLGELAWQAKPDARFLTELGMNETDIPYISDVPVILESNGLKNIHWTVIRGEQFCQYEKTLFENGMSYALSRPDDLEAKEIGEQSEKWFKLMNEFGLKAFSFGWGVFSNESG